jgi:hypothetical protein
MKKIRITKSLLSKFTSTFTAVALVLVTSFGPQLAIAASMTSSKDTATRLKVSTTADHVIVFTLPTGVNFDSTGQTDVIRADFASTFSQGGTWQASDFTFNDGTARTVTNVSAGSGTITCTPSAGVNNVCVAIDTTALIFSVVPDSTYTASANAATVTFTIFGTTTTGTGTLTNPASVANTAIDIAHCDEVASCTSSFTTTNSSQIAFAIADDDQVTVTAVVGSSITFDIDTSVADGETSAPYSVALGTITTADTRISGTTDSVNMIILEGDTSGAGGMVVTVRNANGANGLVSTSTPADDIGSADGTMANGTENYGLCVATGTLAGFSRAAPYNTDSCATNSLNGVQALTTTGENIISSATPFNGGHAEVLVHGAISTGTVAHNDYTDTLTFIATGTF